MYATKNKLNHEGVLNTEHQCHRWISSSIGALRLQLHRTILESIMSDISVIVLVREVDVGV